MPPLVMIYVASRSGQSISLISFPTTNLLLTLRKLSWEARTRRILNLRHPLVPAAFAEQHPGCRSMRQDMATDGLAAVGTSEESVGARVGLDLVGLCFGWVRCFVGGQQ